MKKVRLISSAAMLALLTFGSVTFMSCGKDECPVGMEGNNCDKEIRAEMLGTYNATDKNDADATDIVTYNPNISNGASVTVVNISKFGDFYENTEIVTANVTKSGNVISFTIPEQLPHPEYSVKGSGSYDISAKKLTLNYGITEVSSNSILNYTGTWNKQ
ncbi:MAG TPA: hypothetical protein VLZ83_14930 [Edaphocola sp.]|nr:hypothetical protein [Edaphocola sp.]